MTTSHLAEKIQQRPPDPHKAVDVIGALTSVLANVTGVETTAAGSDFFDDLGADSMLMARFCARVRKRDDLPSFSMKDVYAHRNLAALAAALAPPDSDTVAESALSLQELSTAEVHAREGSTIAYMLCGVLQLALFLGYTLAVATVAALAYRWFEGAPTVLELYVRAVIVGAGAFVSLAVLPIVAKWVLIGRWTPRTIPLWSLGYVRFWVVKTLIRTNPLLLLAVGSPLLPLYLRALGATIGPRVLILTRSVPVCPDLLSIGADTVIRKDAASPATGRAPGIWRSAGCGSAATRSSARPPCSTSTP